MEQVRNRVPQWLYSPLVILVVAFLLRLGWVLAYAPWENEFTRLIANPPNSDSGSYHEVALVLLRNWSQPGRALEETPEVADSVSIRSPGYPLIIALVYAVAGIRPMWIVWVQVAFSLWGCYLAYAALRKITGVQGGAIGGWLYALNPTLIDYTCLVLTETLFVWGAMLIVYCFAAWRASSPPSLLRWGYWIGAAIALTSLIRPSPIWLIPALGLLGAWARPLMLPQRGWFLVAYIIGVVSLFGPWAVYNRIHYGSWRLTIAGELYLLDQTGLVLSRMQKPIHEMRAVLMREVFAQMQRDRVDPYRQVFERGKYYRAVSLHHIRENAPQFAYFWLRGAFFFWRSAGGPNTGGAWIESSRIIRLWFQGYHVLHLLLLVAGLLMAWRSKEHRWWGVLCILTVLYFTLSAGCSGNARFRLQTFAFSLPVAALAWEAGLKRFAHHRNTD